MRHVASMILLALAVPAQATAADDPSKANVVASNPDDKVCENITQVGSRIATKRFCGTRAEWEARQKQDRDVVEDAQRRANPPCQSTMTHSGAPSCM